jgi:hypothetical protein
MAGCWMLDTCLWIHVIRIYNTNIKNPFILRTFVVINCYYIEF